MKRILISITPVLAFAAMAVAQDSNTTTTMTSGGPNLISELWSVDDATTIPEGQVDLRLTYGWQTGSFHNAGGTGDNHVITPSLVWGAGDGLEVFAQVPITFGDGGDVGAADEGNADTRLGFTWRFREPMDNWPAMALRTTFRVPTGNNSDGVDAEFRLILTNEYDSGIRSHMNGFVTTTNGDNDENLREFQWGFIIGLDGPLCADGAVRWVADYVHNSGLHNGSNDIDMVELGWEWDKTATEKIGFALQIGLDHTHDTPDFGAKLSYAYALNN